MSVLRLMSVGLGMFTVYRRLRINHFLLIIWILVVLKKLIAEMYVLRALLYLGIKVFFLDYLVFSSAIPTENVKLFYHAIFLVIVCFPFSVWLYLFPLYRNRITAGSKFCPVWSESSLSAWKKLGSLATHWAHNEDSGQTGRMPGWSESSLGAQSFCWFCHEAAQIRIRDRW